MALHNGSEIRHTGIDGFFAFVSSINQPGDYDAVLGGKNSPPVAAAVLGGLTGARQRLSSPFAEQRVRAIAELERYGESGLALLIQSLQDESILVQRAAYLRLCQRREPTARQALRNYDAYRLFDCLHTLNGHKSGVTAVAVSDDGQIAISAGRDATLRVWDLQTQQEVMMLQEREFVYAIAISPDSRTFTIKLRGQRIKAWDFRTQQQIDPEELPTRTISSVTVSPNRQRTNKHLISGSQNTIKIWNLQTGREVATLRGHTSLVTSVAVSPKERILISGSEDKTVRVWGV